MKKVTVAMFRDGGTFVETWFAAGADVSQGDVTLAGVTAHSGTGVKPAPGARVRVSRCNVAWVMIEDAPEVAKE